LRLRHWFAAAFGCTVFVVWARAAPASSVVMAQLTNVIPGRERASFMAGRLSPSRSREEAKPTASEFTDTSLHECAREEFLLFERLGATCGGMVGERLSE
jgi:hypothetical protein